MAKVLQIAGTIAATLTAGSANILCLRGTANQPAGTAAVAKIRYYAPGTFSNFAMCVTSNNDTATLTVTLKKNAAVSGNESLSIGAGTTGFFEDTSNTDAVTANDDWYVETSIVTAAKTITVTTVSYVFDSTTNTTFKTAVWSPTTPLLSNPTSSATTYFPLGFSVSTTATEANVQTKMNTAGTFKKMYAYIQTNSRSSTTTIGTRVAGASGSIVVSIPTVTTGAFEDTTNTDSLSSGNLCNYYITAGAL